MTEQVPPFKDALVCEQTADFYSWLSIDAVRKGEEDLSKPQVEGGPASLQAVTALRLLNLLNRYEREDLCTTLPQMLFSPQTKKIILKLLTSNNDLVNPKPHFLKLVADDIQKTETRRETVLEVGLEHSLQQLKENSKIDLITVLQTMEVYLTSTQSSKEALELGLQMVEAVSSREPDVRHFAAELVAGLVWVKLFLEQKEQNYDKKCDGKISIINSLPEGEYGESTSVKYHLAQLFKRYPVNVIGQDRYDMALIAGSEDETRSKSEFFMKKSLLPKIKTLAKAKGEYRDEILSFTKIQALTDFYTAWFSSTSKEMTPSEQLGLLDRIEICMKSILGKDWFAEVELVMAPDREILGIQASALSKVLENKLEW